MRTPFIAANWKMNKTVAETEEFFAAFLPAVSSARDVEIIVAPPATSLYAASGKIKGSNVTLASQDVFYELSGAYTGQISPGMLTEIGVAYAIVGHSERRQFFGDTDEVVNKKTLTALANGLKVIFCIGESLAQREAGKTNDVLRGQLTVGLKDVSPDALPDVLVIAYEPVWAIGTGVTASPQQAQDAHKFTREVLAELYGGAAQDIRILYGGSVKPDNVDELMACDDVDGALVGGASLMPDSFARLVNFRRV